MAEALILPYRTFAPYSDPVRFLGMVGARFVFVYTRIPCWYPPVVRMGVKGSGTLAYIRLQEPKTPQFIIASRNMMGSVPALGGYLSEPNNICHSLSTELFSTLLLPALWGPGPEPVHIWWQQRLQWQLWGRWQLRKQLRGWRLF